MNSFTSKTVARAGIAAALALCTCLLANGASAGEPQKVSKAVSYADLDLSKPAGAQALYSRIKRAAREVCGSPDYYRYVSPPEAWRKCVDTAIADAVAKVDRPSLTALHQEALLKDRA
jgi:UrcA family protein